MLGASIGLSLLLHLLAVTPVLLLDSGTELALLPEESVEVDIELAPETPEVFEPELPEPETEAIPEPEIETIPEPEIETIPEPEILPPPEPEVEPETSTTISDAGIEMYPDAQIADAGKVDASLADAQIADDGNADAGLADAQIADASRADAGRELPPIDAGAIALSQDAAVPPKDAATIALRKDAGAARDAGALIATNNTDGGVPPPAVPAWAKLNMATHGPPGNHIAVLLRLDRLRGTQWAPLLADILKPMPDHKLIIGDRNLNFSDTFDFLYITTNNPADLTATTLACISRLKDQKLRDILSHPDVKLDWSAVAGGAMGTFAASRFHHPSDSRVYLKPSPNAIVLTKPKQLAAAMDKRKGLLDGLALRAALPSWVQKIPILDKSTRGPKAPYAMAHITALPQQFEIPRGPIVPAPRHLSLYLEEATRGFVFRGTATFSSAQRAQAFSQGVRQAQADAQSSRLTQMVLKQFSAYNAVLGLKLKQKDTVVTFASALSVADARSMFAFAANWSKRFFAQRPALPKGGKSGQKDTTDNKKTP